MTMPDNPLAVPAITTALTVPSAVDYTSKDFMGFMSSFATYAAQAMPEWNFGASEGDIGLAILEATAYMGDILSYYGDRISQEAYLPTATQRQSLLNIAQLLGYTVSNGQPAKGTVTFQTAAGAGNTAVPPGTQLTGGYVAVVDAQVIYEVDAGQPSYEVPGNGGILTLNVTQGITYSGVTIGTSDGTAAESFPVPQPGVLDGSISVDIESLTSVTEWSYVQFLGDYGPSDQVFTTYLDQAGLMWVQFGDGVNGAIPVNGYTIVADYRVGTGSAGNASTGVVGVFLSPVTGVSTQVAESGTAYVSSAMTGGTDPETNDQIRANAPAWFATAQRAVSLSDFTAMAQNIPGVTAATAVAAHSTSITLYLMGANNQPASDAIQANVENYFEGKVLAGVTVTCAQPTLVPIDIGSSGSQVTLVVQNGFSQAGVLSLVQAALANLLSAPNTTFGQTINVGTIYATVLAITGVSYCVIPSITREDTTQSTTDPIALRGFEIAVPGEFWISVSGGI